MTKTVAIIQARMNSTRLPRKMMLSLKGKPVIEWVVRRVQKATKIDDVVVALADTNEDQELKIFLEFLNANIFQGSEKDVLSRFVEAAEKFKATHVVRICADNPFVCPNEIDRLVECYFDRQCDYAYNHIPRNNSYPDGLGAEIVSCELLKQLDQKATDASEREHVFNYIWNHQDQFDIRTFDPSDDSYAKPEIKLDIDTQEDLNRLSQMNVSMEMSGKEIIHQVQGVYQ